MNILIIGDVVGSPGRSIMKKALRALFTLHDVDYCIANVENAAGGFGVTREICDEFLAMGVDCMTSGNHIWDKREIIPVIDSIPQLLRPANYPEGQPGKGTYVGRAKDSKVPVATLNLSGRVFMNGSIDDPFARAPGRSRRCARRPRSSSWTCTPRPPRRRSPSATTSTARSSAVVGTHTHVPTCDHRILPKGTAYCTDLGMTGPYDSVIGVEAPMIIQRFLTAMPGRFETAKGDPRLAAVVVDVDEKTGLARGIDRMLLTEADVAALA